MIVNGLHVISGGRYHSFYVNFLMKKGMFLPVRNGEKEARNFPPTYTLTVCHFGEREEISNENAWVSEQDNGFLPLVKMCARSFSLFPKMKCTIKGLR